MKDDKTLYTLEERIAMVIASQASSPRAAAAKVKKLGETNPVRILDSDDLDWLYKLPDNAWDSLSGSDMDHYFSFCKLFQAMYRDQRRKTNPCSRFEFGVPLSNTLVMVALALIDRSKKMKNKVQYQPVASYILLSAEDYTDALVDLSFRSDGTLDKERKKKMQKTREKVLAGRNREEPFWRLLADIVTEYMESWQEFDHIDHIICNIDELSYYLKHAESCGFRPVDPLGYFFAEAYEYSFELPDLYDEDLPLGSVRGRIFLSDMDYRIQNISEVAEIAASPELRELLKEYGVAERLDPAAEKINKAIGDLYLLLVEPYLDMQQYHYERPLE